MSRTKLKMAPRSGKLELAPRGHWVLKENEQRKETNGILTEENNVNRALIMTMYSDFGKEPPPELLWHLESLDARHQQVTDFTE
ncbi:hypothetical protein C2845_PM01G47000 [Panicum miliaceum]|uniref:Uncharacterized protein n=1 Tax=Panicum miliaceum TaxID=4540 RepID=A0A3L6THQ5_PANMI|nr:hypothetical protein C2845_PM01G47000 [Panicum miliaceum]